MKNEYTNFELDNESEYIIISNPILEDKIFIEHEYLQALIEKDNKIAFFKEKSEKSEATLIEKEQELNKKEQIILEFAKFLKSQNMSFEEIVEKTGLPIEQINNL